MSTPKISMEIFLTIFKEKLRYYIVKNLMGHDCLTSDELVSILNEQGIKSTKTIVFRNLADMYHEGLLEDSYEMKSSPTRAVKKFKIKEGKKEFVQNIIKMVK